MATSIAAITGDLLRSPNLQVENPMAANLQYQQAQAEKQRVAESQQEGQLNALKIQEAQQQMASQQAISQAFLKANGNIPAAIPLALQGGARPADVLALQQKDTEQKKAISDLDTATLANHNKHTQDALQTLGPIAQIPDGPEAEQRYLQAMPALLQGHDLDPSDLAKAGLDPTKYPGQIALQHWVAGLNGYQQGIANEQKNREIAAQEATAGATVAEKNVDTTQKQRALDAAQLATAAKQGPQAYQAALEALPYGRAKVFEGVTDPTQLTRLGMTPEEQTRADQTAAQQAATQSHNTAMEKLGAGRLAVENGRLQMEKQQMGMGASGTVSPAAQMAADGRMDPQTLRAMMRRNPGIVAQIQQVDPQFDEANIDKRYNTLRDFTNTSNTKAGGQALALNTLIHHADLYQQVGDALKNGSFVPGNAAYNAVSQMMGAPAPGNANLVARFLAGETAKVATGGVPAEGEVNGILKSLGTNASPDQIKQAGQTLLQVAAGRAIPLQETVHDAKLDNVVHVLKPDAQAILAKRGYDPNTLKPVAQGGGGNGVTVKAPNGKTYTFKSQAAADTFKKNAGIQ